MRNQYHFWPRGDSFDAWDVDRVIDLSRDLPIRDVDLYSVREVDTVYWFDEDAGPPTVRRVVDHVRWIEEADMSFPIILGFDGRVMDGIHRVARALLDGLTTIKVVRFEEPPQPDYLNCRPEDLPYD